MQKKRHGSRKHLIFQKVIVSYMKDAENDILNYGRSYNLRQVDIVQSLLES